MLPRYALAAGLYAPVRVVLFEDESGKAIVYCLDSDPSLTSPFRPFSRRYEKLKKCRKLAHFLSPRISPLSWTSDSDRGNFPG